MLHSGVLLASYMVLLASFMVLLASSRLEAQGVFLASPRNPLLLDSSMSPLGFLQGSSWLTLGVLLGSFRNFLGFIQESSWLPLGVLLASCRGSLCFLEGSSWLPPWVFLASSRGPFGFLTALCWWLYTHFYLLLKDNFHLQESSYNLILILHCWQRDWSMIVGIRRPGQ